MILRDYEYIDVARIVDYMSSVDPGVAQEFTQKMKSDSGVEGNAGINLGSLQLGGKGQKGKENEIEQTVRIYAQHMFSRLYENLDDSLMTVDADEVIINGALPKSAVVEVTRHFKPSPVIQMLDTFTQIIGMMESMGLSDTLQQQFGSEEKRQQVMAIVDTLRGRDNDREIPMFARSNEPDASSVIFVARDNYVLGDITEFGGEMTLFGKVQEHVPSGSSVDMLDLLKVLPAGMRQAEGFGAEFKGLLKGLLSDWPKELGGPVNTKEVVIEGPAVIMTPVAAYRI